MEPTGFVAWGVLFKGEVFVGRSFYLLAARKRDRGFIYKAVSPMKAHPLLIYIICLITC